ncbi:MAG TPA: adenylate/guanylate cyclase domain-containing protein, partial [Candidatus Limnocylindria bacterium]
FRKFLEAVATAKPLVVVIDDLHWAEPTMLDLVDHIADWSREAPILLLAIARPELLDARPQWGGGKLNATTILLEPLGPEDSALLIGNLVEDQDLAKTVQDRIGETAEGNPLFVEELVAMLVDQGVLQRENGGWHAVDDLQAVPVPPSISALVAARLDHLEPMERDLIGRASVVGKTFQRSAVAELSPPESRDDLGSRLMRLVRKELVRPDRSATVGDEAFRFRHLLVRDAAYASLTKEQRADLHARFADWLERLAADRLMEYQEVIGYHLEQASRYRSELGLADDVTASLASRGLSHLRAAGERALARNDRSGALNLLTRAAALTTDDHDRTLLLLDASDSATVTGDMAGAQRHIQEAREAAARTGDEILVMRAEMERFRLETVTNPAVDEAAYLALADRLAALASTRGDNGSLVAAEVARGTIFLNHCRWTESLEAWERARALMNRNESSSLAFYVTAMATNALRYGPVASTEAIARIEALAAEREPQATALLASSAPLLAMQGRFDEARDRCRAARDYFADRGMLQVAGGGNRLASASIERLAGDELAVEREVSAGVETLTRMGETGVLSTLAGMLAEASYRLGRRKQMDEAIRLAQETGAPNDIATQACWRWVAATAAADDGDIDRAREIIGEAVALAEPTDFLELRANVFEVLAHVEAKAGQPDAWRAALERALAEHERKENLVEAKRVRELLEKGPA